MIPVNKKPLKPSNTRLVKPEVAQLLFDLMTSEKWLAQIVDRGINSVPAAKQYILDKMHPDLKLKGFINYIIIDLETKGEIGTCSLHDRNGAGRI